MPHNLEVLDEYIQLGRIGLWKAIQKHDPQKGKLSTIAWNHIRWEIIRHINKAKKHRSVLSGGCLNNDSAHCNDSENIWEAIPDHISELEKKVINLKYQGCTFKEIGYELGFTKGWAYKTFHNIKNKIRNT